MSTKQFALAACLAPLEIRELAMCMHSLALAAVSQPKSADDDATGRQKVTVLNFRVIASHPTMCQ
jgi:hypothetical protein